MIRDYHHSAEHPPRMFIRKFAFSTFQFVKKVWAPLEFPQIRAQFIAGVRGFLHVISYTWSIVTFSPNAIHIFGQWS